MAEEHIEPSAAPTSTVGPPVSTERIAPGPPPARPADFRAPVASPAPPKSPQEKTKAPPEPKDNPREVIETVVFVVVLVLLLKTFLAEAFVIPTGSMATTLLGYHKGVTCEQCGTHFLVNLSREVDPDEPPPRPVTGAWCPNCHYYNRLRKVAEEKEPPP